jgi:hypothetical protein
VIVVLAFVGYIALMVVFLNDYFSEPPFNLFGMEVGGHAG